MYQVSAFEVRTNDHGTEYRVWHQRTVENKEEMRSLIAEWEALGYVSISAVGIP
jgi:hypothetical protein